MSFEIERYFRSIAKKLFLALGVGNALTRWFWEPNFEKPARFRLRSRAALSFEMKRFFRSVTKKLFLALGVGNAPTQWLGGEIL